MERLYYLAMRKVKGRLPAELIQADVRIDWQMVRGDARLTTAMNFHAFDPDRRIVVDPVEWKHRKGARMRTNPFSSAERMTELGAKEARGAPVEPFVKISEQEARPVECAPVHDV